jgi:hypothetical protein
VYCWGDTSHGQAGVDPVDSKVTDNPIAAPTRVAGLDNVELIDTVKDHTCVTRLTAPFLLCWGSNVYDGQIVHKLGPGAAELTYSARPIAVDLGFPVVDVGMGPESTYAKTFGENWVFAWGLNTRRQLGVESQDDIVLVPSVVVHETVFQIERLIEVKSLLRSAGFGQCASVLDPPYFKNSSFICWGENDHGELGLGDEAAAGAETPLPIPVATLPRDSRELARGEDHVCAIAAEEEGREEIRCYGAAHLVGNGTTRSEDGSVAVQWQGKPLRWNAGYVPVILE